MKQLEQITDGFYVSEGTKAITVKPTEVAFGKYFMLSTLGRFEYEDIGARLVEAARERGQWVGMAYSTLGKQLVSELEYMRAENKKRMAEINKPRKGLLARAYESAKSLLGGKQPVVETVQPKTEEEKPKRPRSVLTFLLLTQGQNGPAILGSEIRGMANEGYLDLVEYEDQTILMPTQKFAETVYKAQQAQRRST